MYGETRPFSNSMPLRQLRINWIGIKWQKWSRLECMAPATHGYNVHKHIQIFSASLDDLENVHRDHQKAGIPAKARQFPSMNCTYDGMRTAPSVLQMTDTGCWRTQRNENIQKYMYSAHLESSDTAHTDERHTKIHSPPSVPRAAARVRMRMWNRCCAVDSCSRYRPLAKINKYSVSSFDTRINKQWVTSFDTKTNNESALLTPGLTNNKPLFCKPRQTLQNYRLWTEMCLSWMCPKFDWRQK